MLVPWNSLLINCDAQNAIWSLIQTSIIILSTCVWLSALFHYVCSLFLFIFFLSFFKLSVELFHLFIQYHWQHFYKFLLRGGEHTNILEAGLGSKQQNLSGSKLEWNHMIVSLADSSNHRGLSSLLPVFVHLPLCKVDIRYFWLTWQWVAVSVRVGMTVRGASQQGQGRGSQSKRVGRDLWIAKFVWSVCIITVLSVVWNHSVSLAKIMKNSWNYFI